jgi:hypothetical protein
MRWPFFFGRTSAAEGSQAPEVRSSGREWASLPAIQRVVGEPQLTAPTAAFVDSLAGTHDPDLSLEPLGHHVSLEGPSGLVGGLARSVETYAPSSELVGRPRPRREATVQRRTFSAEEAMAPPPLIEGDAEPGPAQVLLSFGAIDELVQVAAPLTRLAEADASAVLRLAMPRSVATAPAAPAGEPVRAEMRTEPAARPVTAPRLTLGQSRRLGLGAPLPHERTFDAPSLDLAPAGRRLHGETVEAAPMPDSPSAAHAEGAAPVTPPVERIAPIAGSTLARAISPDAAVAVPPGELPIARFAAAKASGSPAHEHAVVQRVVARPLPPIIPRPEAAPMAPIASQRPPLMRPADSLEVATEAGEPVLVQRLATVAPGGAHAPLSAAAAQQAFGPPISPEGPAAPATPLRALPPLAPLAPPVQRVTTAAQDLVLHSPFATVPAEHTVQRATSVVDLAAQREVAAGESPAPEPTVASAPVAVPPAGPAASAAPGQSDKDLDELGRKLYDRISLQLRRDILIQRERAGMVTDLR